MPELPEVETVRRSLDKVLPGHRVLGTDLIWPGVVGYPTPAEFVQNVKGLEFVGTGRRGKYLRLEMSAGKTLVVHLRMTGQLRYQPESTQEAPHTHAVLHLDGGYKLSYADQRKFGRFYLAEHDAVARIAGMDKLGPEPLSEDFTVGYLLGLANGRKAPAKSFLLDQRHIAGVGNIYADEALFRAGIVPWRAAGSLNDEDIRRLHDALVAVLKNGVDYRGTTFSHYVDGLGETGAFQEHLAVYGREGKPCPKCGTLLERKRIGGRSSHYCPKCQV